MRADIPFEEAWSMLAIAQAAEAAIETGERDSALDYEIGEGVRAQWYLVRTAPGDDARALRWLARRRFGVFSPKQQRRTRKDGGAVVQGFEPVFPGWLFVFCWDVGRMKARIEACPGVAGLLCFPGTGRPVPIGEGFIDELRALSWVYDDAAPGRGHHGARAVRNERRIAQSLGKRERKELQRLTLAMKRVGMWDGDEWERIKALEPGKRIALLKRALLSPVAAGGSGAVRT